MRPLLPKAASFALAAAFVVACRSGEPPPGEPSAFDPLASIPQVSTYAGSDWYLVAVNGRGMGLDGTLDLEAESHKPHVTYVFQREVGAPKDAPPPGASGASPDGRWHERVAVRIDPPGTSWHESRMGDGVNVERDVITEGMLKDQASVEPGAPDPQLPKPKCSFAELWKKTGAELPANSVGDFAFDEQGYELRDRVNSETHEFDFDCAPRD